MAKYEVGDRVVVRDDLVLGNAYTMDDPDDGRWGVVNGMLKFCGRTVTIKEVYGYGYDIEEFGCIWTDEMFSGYEILDSGEIDISQDDILLLL